MFLVLRRKISTLRQKNRRELSLFFEAYWQLGLARAAVLTLPFNQLSKDWGVPYFEEFRYPPKDPVFMRQLRWAIASASKYTPWDSNCLAQAIAAKKMLRKCGYTSTLYLGMTTPSAHEDGEVEAHAWLRCGDTWICGLRASQGFRVVTSFAETKAGAAANLSNLPVATEAIAKLK